MSRITVQAFFSALFGLLLLSAALSTTLARQNGSIASGGAAGIQNQSEKAQKTRSDSAGKPLQNSTAPESGKGAQIHGFISPSDTNVQLGPDVRSLVVMAAVNMAGFDFETAGEPLSPARAELRRDLAKMPADLKAELASFYSSHRRAGVDELTDALRYETLAMLMNQPPAFAVYTSEDKIPEDIRPLLGFAPLVQDFYMKSGIKAVLPKYLKLAEVYDNAYRARVGECIYDTFNYFHATPETIVHMKPLVISDENGRQSKEVARSRARFVFVVVDPFLPIGSSLVRDDVINQKEDLTFRRVGDDYTVVIGPSRQPNIGALRSALIRFALDPMLERHLKTSLGYKDQILKLESKASSAKLGSSVYLIMRQSLVVASDARLRQIRARESGAHYTPDDATYDLAKAYENGAVLVFHFYQALLGYEQVGINIEDFLDQMLATTDWDKEAKRPEEFQPIVARVTAERSRAANETTATNPEAVSPDINNRIVQSDELIRQRRYAEARPLLEQVLAIHPKNARALYGMAQVVNQTPSKEELDPNVDENDKIQGQHDRLEYAIKLYREAISSANPTEEAWLIQWSHVLIGRILDFQEFRRDAVAEYEKAVGMGEIPSGAYKEAIEGKDHPFGQKQ